MDRIHKAQEQSKKRGPSSRRGGKVVIPRTPIAEEEDEKPRYDWNLCGWWGYSHVRTNRDVQPKWVGCPGWSFLKIYCFFIVFAIN